MSEALYFKGYLDKKEAIALSRSGAREELLKNFRWNGEIRKDKRTIYWCPTDQQWVNCSGTETCPHKNSKVEEYEMKVMERIKCP